MGRHAPPARALPPRRARGIRELLLGVGAAIALVVLILGVPVALAHAIGWPLPRELPSLGMLRSPVDAAVIVRALAVLVWLAWAQFTACVLAEVRAELSGVELPRVVPGPPSSQLLARQLVGATLLLLSATASLHPLIADLGREWGTGADRAPAPVTAAPTAYASSSPTAAPAETRRPHLRPPPDVKPAANGRNARPQEPPPAPLQKLYRVNPPDGRHHESLWEIAERHLGDGRRYQEIFSLNKDRVQPDGERLHLARLIRPGWILHLPPDAVGVETVRADPAPRVDGPRTNETAGRADRRTGGRAAEASGAGTSTEQPSKTMNGSATGAAGLPARQPTSSPGPRTRVDGIADRGPLAAGEDTPARLPDALAGATLLAAGVLAALGRRRRAQLWHRAWGRRIRRPAGEAATAEEMLRHVADPASTRRLDLALRSLSLTLADLGRPLPPVYAVRLGDSQLDLLLSPADRDAPAPWQAVDGGSIWRLPVTAEPGLIGPRLSEVLAPYPGLVSLGSDASGRVLVDLEAAGGLVALVGPGALTRSVLAAVAAELATNRWSDHMRVTMVGFGAQLCVLAPERLRSVATVADVLPELESRAEEVGAALAIAGVDSVLTGRLHGVSGDAWMPHYVLVATSPAPEEVDRLARLARPRGRSALGFIVAAPIPAPSWSWQVDLHRRLRVPLLGIDVEAQLLPPEQYAAVCALLEAAADVRGGAAPPLLARPDEPVVDSEALAALERPAAVDLRILGPVEVTAPGTLDEGRRAACTEMAVYLAAHPEGAHADVLGGAIWPRGVSAALRDSTIARLRDWLGRDAAGEPNLRVGIDGRLRLGPEVRTDWDMLRTLARLAESDPEAAESYLHQALRLVRGPLLAGHAPSRYAWLAGTDLESEVPARLADLAHQLVELRLARGDAAGAVAAARATLVGAPEEETLWRDLLRAVAATRDVPRLRALVGELQARVEADPLIEDLPPETEALIDELLPSWRLSVAR